MILKFQVFYKRHCPHIPNINEFEHTGTSVHIDTFVLLGHTTQHRLDGRRQAQSADLSRSSRTGKMPGKLKVKIVAAQDLPVMDRASELTDAFVEVTFHCF
ncbi:hypothetical protein LSAT2_005962 [Lamellibrachia satsuma]|nr:hypothetical protein LSAT2_005962 [Lamellibrachia satsuma]